jgi:hypothetical protein
VAAHDAAAEARAQRGARDFAQAGGGPVAVFVDVEVEVEVAGGGKGKDAVCG